MDLSRDIAAYFHVDPLERHSKSTLAPPATSANFQVSDKLYPSCLPPTHSSSVLVKVFPPTRPRSGLCARRAATCLSTAKSASTTPSLTSVRSPHSPPKSLSRPPSTWVLT